MNKLSTGFLAVLSVIVLTALLALFVATEQEVDAAIPKRVARAPKDAANPPAPRMTSPVLYQASSAAVAPPRTNKPWHPLTNLVAAWSNGNSAMCVILYTSTDLRLPLRLWRFVTNVPSMTVYSYSPLIYGVRLSNDLAAGENFFFALKSNVLDGSTFFVGPGKPSGGSP